MNQVLIGSIGLGAIFLTLWLIELTSRIKAGRQLKERDGLYREEIRRLSHENKSLVTRIKQSTLTQTLLLDSLIRINSKMKLPEIQEDVVSAARELLNAKQVALFLAERGTDMLAAVSSRGLSAEQGRVLKYRIGEGKVGCVAQRRVPMMDREFELELMASRSQIDKAAYAFFDPVVCAPITFQNRLLGVLAAADVPGLSDEDKQLLMTIAQASAIALSNAMSFEQLQDVASVDGLTKLYNIQNFRERLREEVKRAQRFQHPFSIIIFDIDHFKNYNDSHGHPMGDRLLVQFATVVKKTLRETDLLARYGGDEFIILCPETEKKQGGLAAERIRKLVNDFPFPHRETQPLGLVSISAGVATCPEDGLQPDELIKAADESLYEAKRGGRNRIVVCKPIRLREI